MKFYLYTLTGCLATASLPPEVEQGSSKLSPVEQEMKPKEKQINDLLILQTAEKGLALLQVRASFSDIIKAITLKHEAFQAMVEHNRADLESALGQAKEKFQTSRASLDALATSTFELHADT